MRLLRCNDSNSVTSKRTFTLTRVGPRNIPSYAILSHRWADNEDDEVSFKDVEICSGSAKPGYKKLEFCAAQAAIDGISHFWVDTCCIDKSSSTELTQAINSMFQWYRNATKCYVYLPDVSTKAKQGWESAFMHSNWFTRGWTLQELIAPTVVEFFSVEGDKLGNKRSLEQQICEITGIPGEVLRGRPLHQVDQKERFSWMAKRQTTVDEDAAYCLLGIFDIHMPLIYGEGREKALARLRRKVDKVSQPDLFFTRDNESVKFNDRPPLGSSPTSYQFHNGIFSTSTRNYGLNEERYAQVLQRQVHDLLPLIETEIISAFEKKYHQLLSSHLDRVDTMVGEALNDFMRDSHESLRTNFNELPSLKTRVDLHTESVEYVEPKTSQSVASKRAHSARHYTIHARQAGTIYYKRTWIFQWRLGTFSITIIRRGTLHGFEVQDFEANLHFRPNPALLAKGLAISYGHQYDARGNRRISPILFTFNTVPMNAEILVASARGEKHDIEELFARKCASPTDEDPEGRNALYFAARNGHSELCEYLIGQGMPLPSISGALNGAHRYMFQLLDGDVPYNDNTGFERYISICKTLESKGCLVADTDTMRLRMWLRGEEMVSPVRQLSLNDRQIDLSRKWFAFLKDFDLSIDCDYENGSTFCWMQLVCLSGDPSLLHMFLLNGASVRCRHTEKYSLFQLVMTGAMALDRSDEELMFCLAMLLVSGCDPNQRDTEGRTPNLVASIFEKTKIWGSALRLADIDIPRYLQIEDERFGVSTVVEEVRVPKDGLRQRFTHDYDNE